MKKLEIKARAPAAREERRAVTMTLSGPRPRSATRSTPVVAESHRTKVGRSDMLWHYRTTGVPGLNPRGSGATRPVTGQLSEALATRFGS